MKHPALLVAVALGASGIALGTPSSATLVRAEALGAVTTITAATSGTAEVALYDDATLSPKATGNPDVSISGGGRLVGFDLVPATGRDPEADQLSAMRLPSFAGGRVSVSGSTTPKTTCTPFPNSTVDLQDQCTAPTPKAITLHEGYYHLVVITDGSPVRITLRLHGQQRRHAAVRMQHTLRTAEANLPRRETLGSNAVSFGNEITFPGATQLATVVGVRMHTASAMKAFAGCARADSGAPPPYAYAPPCPGGSMTTFSYQVTPPANPAVGDVVGVGVSSYDIPAGSATQSGIGGSVADSDGPTYLGGVGLWIAGDQISFSG